MTDTSSMGEIPDDWIEHDGKGMPVSGETSVDIKCRHETLWGSGSCRPSMAMTLRWEHLGLGGDIIAYRVVSP